MAATDEPPGRAPDLESFRRSALAVGQGNPADHVDTSELRWFATGPLPADVELWFAGPDVTATAEHRCDVYQLTGLSEVGVKRRSGLAVEAKIRLAVGPPMALAEGLEATFDRWRKWRPSPNDPIWPSPQARWVEVDKTLLTRTHTMAGDESVASGDEPVASGDEPVASGDAASVSVSGCDVELAAITIGELAAWTLAFEAFGPERQRRRAVLSAWQAIAADAGQWPDLGSRFDLAAGYPEWLQVVMPHGAGGRLPTRSPR